MFFWSAGYEGLWVFLDCGQVVFVCVHVCVGACMYVCMCLERYAIYKKTYMRSYILAINHCFVHFYLKLASRFNYDGFCDNYFFSENVMGIGV